MNDHLAKPVTPAALYQALARWLPAQDTTAPSAAQAPDTQRPAADLRLFVAELARLLAENDVHAASLWREQGLQLDELAGPTAGKITQAIALFEFEEAAALLAGLVAAHPELGATGQPEA